ncbi:MULTISPECIES: ATP-binding protein [Mycobacterium avium complex (MAC)]|uniref:ATP-binding protein n=1 Tax=Mycobacterium colombiense TaxID=339268 RepID=A0A329LVT8_9MYCO|nr:MULTISPECIES: ATP-binding protein [Mycobacterium avium complex (MAC)]OBG17945.1 hypothetical protein A5769_13255 [Mycobacterium intracellulare]RAV08837.1 ATP-binding protein [Mycobacterium colombiense]
MSTQADTTRPGAIDLAPGVQLPPEIVTAGVAVLANRGGGKSAVTHRLVELMHTAGLPVVVLDVKGDWWGIRSSADGKGPGLPFVIFGGDHHDVPLEPTAGQLLADLIVDDRIPAVLDLSHMSKAQARTFATAFAERLYHRNRDPLHVVIEEADVLIPQRVSADTARLLGAMEDLAKRGRHRGLGLTVVSQRAQETAKSVLELMETVILLRMTGPRSIKAVQDWINVNADHDDTTARQVIASLPSLAVGEGWVWSPGFLRILKRTTFPMFTTFDSHATPKPGQTRVVPKKRADIDLDKLGAEIAATRERAHHNDPHTLHAEIQTLRSQLAAASARADQATRQASSSAQLLEQRESEIATLRAQLTDLQTRRHEDPHVVKALRSAAELINSALHTLTTAPTAPTPPAHETTSPTRPADPKHPSQPRPTNAATAQHNGDPCSPTTLGQPAEPNSDAPLRFRSGAHRMITALARMAPLRLTKSQWATVARMKHTGGTWSTYLGQLRRAGLIDENATGFTLTEAGWQYVGHRPKPMTAQELQQHYLGILRAGAARMLQAAIDAYPNGLTRDQIAQAADVSVSGGTFSTYLGQLRRNGLVEQRGDLVVATDVLMHAASGASDSLPHRDSEQR